MLANWIASLWSVIKALAESNFMIAAIGSLAGAAGGAYAIQKISEHAKRRDMLLEELRMSCHAIDMAHGVCSTYMNLKKEHVLALKGDYERDRATVHRFAIRKQFGLEERTILRVGMDYQFMNEMKTRAPNVETMVLEKISAPVRVRSAAVSLGRCTDQLNVSIVQRSELIPKLAAMEEGERVARTFGLPIPGGFDNAYGDYVGSIYQYTDDSIYFSRMVVDDLTIYAKHVRERYQRMLPRRSRRHVMMVPRVVWADPEYERFLPPAENYASWYTGFVYRVPGTKGQYLRKGTFVIKRWVKRNLKYASCGMGERA